MVTLELLEKAYDEALTQIERMGYNPEWGCTEGFGFHDFSRMMLDTSPKGLAHIVSVFEGRGMCEDIARAYAEDQDDELASSLDAMIDLAIEAITYDEPTFVEWRGSAFRGVTNYEAVVDYILDLRDKRAPAWDDFDFEDFILDVIGGRADVTDECVLDAMRGDAVAESEVCAAIESIVCD